MENRRGPLLLRPKFLLFCLYVMAYLTIRAYGEIVDQTVDMRTGNIITKQYIVGSSPTAPRWRRQVYRAIFSPLMVVEEETRRILANSDSLMGTARDYLGR